MTINKKILEKLEQIEPNENKRQCIIELLEFEYKHNDQYNSRFTKKYRETVNKYYQ